MREYNHEHELEVDRMVRRIRMIEAMKGDVPTSIEELKERVEQGFARRRGFHVETCDPSA